MKMRIEEIVALAVVGSLIIGVTVGFVLCYVIL